MRAAWPRESLGELIRLERRPVEVIADRNYQEIGTYSYGRGIFHKRPRCGLEVGDKDLFLMKEGDLILQITFAWEGAIALCSKAEDGLCGSVRYPTYRVDESRCFAPFLVKYLCTRQGLDQIGRICPGSAGRNRVLALKRLPEINVPLPPLDEQRRIVERIEILAAKVEAARGLRDHSAEEVEAIAAAQTTKIFDTLNDHPRKDLSSLGVNGENPIQIGPFGAQLHASEFVPEGVPVLKVGNVWPTGLRLQSLDYVTPSKAAQLRRYEIKADDLLFARSGATLGKVCLVPPECDGWLMTGHLFRVRFDPKQVFNRYAFAALRGAKQLHDQVFGQVRGATRPGYNTTLLGSVQLPLPPLDKQRRIVAELDALQAKVDAVKALQTETSVELDAMLPAILDKAFKGEL